MAHGYNCIKELYLDRYAAAVADAGHVVLAYDHRNFGESDGEPRQELDPWMQVRDYRNAITFVQTLDGVDPERIGIWGTSYAGGHVLVVAAIDRRVRCVVAQVPTISGWQATLRRIAPQALPGQRDAWDADRLERYKGNPPKMVPMVVDPAAGGEASHASADAWDFFTGKNAPEEDKWRFKKWRNEITLRSLEMYSEYEPGAFIERIAPTPAAHGARRRRRRLPHRPRPGGVQSRRRAEAAGALSRRSLLGLHRPVRPRGEGCHRMVHAASAAMRDFDEAPKCE